jgi:hypothetical protein
VAEVHAHGVGREETSARRRRGFRRSGAIDGGSQRVATASSGMQERDGLRSRASGRSQLVPRECERYRRSARVNAVAGASQPRARPVPGCCMRKESLGSPAVPDRIAWLYDRCAGRMRRSSKPLWALRFTRDVGARRACLGHLCRALDAARRVECRSATSAGRADLRPATDRRPSAASRRAGP